MGIFRRLRFASLGDTPKKLTKGGKRVAPSPPEDRLSKKGKGGKSPSYARPHSIWPDPTKGWGMAVGANEKKEKKREEEERGSRALCA